jgi:[ribosomal protein S5]-alanine N-acetyltransferase
MGESGAPVASQSSDPFDPIETHRLRLRCVNAADAEPTASMMCAKIASRLASWPLPFTLEMAQDRVRRARIAAIAGKAVPLAILHLTDATFLGWVDAFRLGDDPRRAGLGYWIGETHQGQGFMHEAAIAAVEAAFRILDVDAIEAGAQPSNAASLAVIRRLGMTPIGEREVLVRATNQVGPCLYFELRR